MSPLKMLINLYNEGMKTVIQQQKEGRRTPQLGPFSSSFGTVCKRAYFYFSHSVGTVP